MSKTHIRNRILELTSQYESVNTPILIYDIPLLIEGGMVFHDG